MQHNCQYLPFTFQFFFFTVINVCFLSLFILHYSLCFLLCSFSFFRTFFIFFCFFYYFFFFKAKNNIPLSIYLFFFLFVFFRGNMLFFSVYVIGLGSILEPKNFQMKSALMFFGENQIDEAH